MPNRIIRETCATSLTLAMLSDAAERFFWRLTTIADDYGRFDANPDVLQGRCVPTLNWSRAKVSKCVAELSMCSTQDEPLVRLYKVGSRLYGHLTKWTTHQRDRSKEPNPPKSKFPSPDEGLYVEPQVPAAKGGESQQFAALNESESESRETNTGVGPPPQIAANGSAHPKGCPLPEDWMPGESHRKLASARGLDMALEAAHFKGKAIEENWLARSWDQKFTNWMLQEIKFRQRRSA